MDAKLLVSKSIGLTFEEPSTGVVESGGGAAFAVTIAATEA